MHNFFGFVLYDGQSPRVGENKTPHNQNYGVQYRLVFMMGKSWQHLWGWGERAPMLTPSLFKERDHLGSGPYLT
jgi:hypothetical protein